MMNLVYTIISLFSFVNEYIGLALVGFLAVVAIYFIIKIVIAILDALPFF